MFHSHGQSERPHQADPAWSHPFLDLSHPQLSHCPILSQIKNRSYVCVGHTPIAHRMMDCGVVLFIYAGSGWGIYAEGFHAYPCIVHTISRKIKLHIMNEQWADNIHIHNVLGWYINLLAHTHTHAQKQTHTHTPERGSLSWLTWWGKPNMFFLLHHSLFPE